MIRCAPLAPILRTRAGRYGQARQTPAPPAAGTSTSTRLCPACTSAEIRIAACAPARGPWSPTAISTEIDENAVFLDGVIEQRQLAVAVPEKPQHRRHPVDRILQRHGNLDMAGAQRGPDVDEIAQHIELHRRVARAMAAIRQHLRRQLVLDRAQRPHDALLAAAEGDKTGDQPLERAQPRRAGKLPRRGARQMAQLPGEAHQHRPTQQPVGLAASDFVEMDEPCVDPRRQHIGAPGDGVPAGIVGQPALHQRARRILGAAADVQQIGDPGKIVPCREPVHAGVGRNHTGTGLRTSCPASVISLSVRIAAPFLASSRPALTDPQSQIRRNAADQRMAIERAPRGKAAQRRRAAVQPGQQRRRLLTAAAGAPGAGRRFRPPRLRRA